MDVDRWLRRLAMFPLSRPWLGSASSSPAVPKRVSVVIPCYNYGRYLERCVESAISQQGVEVDVLIVDDASPDGSAQIAHRLARQHAQISVLEHAVNRGHIATYNDGLSQATGDYVVLLSADDLLHPGALARAVALMEAHPEVGLTYGRARDFVDEPPRVTQDIATTWTIWRGREWLSDRCRTGRNPIRSCEAVMRSSIYKQLGQYDSELPHTADFDLWMRAALISDVGYVGGTIQAWYRVHGNNMHVVDFRNDQAQGTIIDLRERLKTFDSVFASLRADPSAERLQKVAHQTLAREALTLAIRAHDWGTTDQWPVVELLDFADDLTEPEDLRRWKWSLRMRKAVNHNWAARRLLGVPAGRLYRLRSRLIQWRWAHAGV
jgi:glycosyltransferase involved in cell wall biosynthesis